MNQQPTNNEQTSKSLTSPGDFAGAAGYTPHPSTLDNISKTSTAANNINNEDFLNQLTQKVYELLESDLRLQRERVRNYGSRGWW